MRVPNLQLAKGGGEAGRAYHCMRCKGHFPLDPRRGIASHVL